MPNTNIWTEVSPLGDVLVKVAHLYPQRDALVFPDERCSFAELLEGANHIARGLLAQGVKPGEHVGVLAPNRIVFMQAFFGIALMGAVIVPLNVRHKSSELGYIVCNADIVALLTTAESGAHVDFVDLLCDAIPGLNAGVAGMPMDLAEFPRLKRAIVLQGESRKGFIDRRTFDTAATSIDDARLRDARRGVALSHTAIIIYTSGTTANPKGCMLSHEALTRGPIERASHRLASGAADVHWSSGPLFHIGSLGPALGALGAGCTYVTDLFYDAKRALGLIREEKATTIWPWFPAIVLGLLEQSEFDAAHLPHLRRIVLIATPTLVERVQQRFPDAQILQGCGMTETAGIFGLSRETDTAQERATTQGKAYPGIQVRIADVQDGSPAPAGIPGEILVRGYCVMNGYYKDPEKTAQALDADGWLHTGDLYVRTENDNLIFNGRLKDMLKVGGENVAVVEIETYLCQHPAVRIAEVVGKPDSRLDEVPIAFVELHAGADITETTLIEFCKGRIANYKIPREVHFVTTDAWPMSLTKIDKRGLRLRVAQLQAERSA